MTTVDSTAIELGDIIAAPILATVNADFQAARQFVEYIKTYGFSAGTKKSGDFGKLKMVSFAFPQATPGGGMRTKVMQLPELSMVPLPILQVDKADYTFGVRIISGERRSPPGDLNLAGDPDALPNPKALKWMAMLAPPIKRSADEAEPDASPYLDANVEARISVRMGDVPAGIGRILALLGSEVMILTGLAELDPEDLALAPGQLSSSVTLLTTDPERVGVPNVVVRLEPHQKEIEVYADGEATPWAVGAARTTDKQGHLQFKVRLSDWATPEDAYMLRFVTSIEGGDVEARLPISCIPQPQRSET